MTSLYWILSQNSVGGFNDILGYTFDDSKERFLVGKTDLESILDESGFGAATEMVGFAVERPRSILGTRTFFYIHLHFISIGWNSF